MFGTKLRRVWNSPGHASRGSFVDSDQAKWNAAQSALGELATVEARHASVQSQLQAVRAANSALKATLASEASSFTGSLSLVKLTHHA